MIPVISSSTNWLEAFDHMHGYVANNMSLGLYDSYKFTPSMSESNGTELPSQREHIPFAIARGDTRIYFLNLHFQGNGKPYLPYDVCRVLALTGDKKTYSAVVSKHCKEALVQHGGGANGEGEGAPYPCLPHETVENQAPRCVRYLLQLKSTLMPVPRLRG
jgi:hypothetical protein